MSLHVYFSPYSFIPTLQATIIVPRCGTIIVASFITMLKATIFVPRIVASKGPDGEERAGGAVPEGKLSYPKGSSRNRKEVLVHEEVS